MCIYVLYIQEDAMAKPGRSRAMSGVRKQSWATRKVGGAQAEAREDLAHAYEVLVACSEEFAGRIYDLKEEMKTIRNFADAAAAESQEALKRDSLASQATLDVRDSCRALRSLLDRAWERIGSWSSNRTPLEVLAIAINRIDSKIDVTVPWEGAFRPDLADRFENLTEQLMKDDQWGPLHHVPWAFYRRHGYVSRDLARRDAPPAVIAGRRQVAQERLEAKRREKSRSVRTARARAFK
jgi:hypothetical protein